MAQFLKGLMSRNDFVSKVLNRHSSKKAVSEFARSLRPTVPAWRPAEKFLQSLLPRKRLRTANYRVRARQTQLLQFRERPKLCLAFDLERGRISTLHCSKLWRAGQRSDDTRNRQALKRHTLDVRQSYDAGYTPSVIAGASQSSSKHSRREKPPKKTVTATYAPSSHNLKPRLRTFNLTS